MRSSTQPALLRHLKIRIDEDRKRAGRYLLTGSQVFALMQGLSESLAGRCARLNLFTLSGTELLAAAPPWHRVDVMNLGKLTKS